MISLEEIPRTYFDREKNIYVMHHMIYLLIYPHNWVMNILQKIFS